MIPFAAMWGELKRVTKPRGAIVLFGSQPFTSALIMSNPAMFKYELIWDKPRASGSVHAKNKPMKSHENIMVFSHGTTVHESQSDNRMNYFPQMEIGKPYKKFNRAANKSHATGMSARPSHVDYLLTNSGQRYPRSVINFDNGNHSNLHPTQKPVALMEYLIKTYTNESETVLDFTMGSGSTGVAALKTGRRFIGIEREPEYFAIAERRIEEVANPAQLELIA